MAAHLIRKYDRNKSNYKQQADLFGSIEGMTVDSEVLQNAKTLRSKNSLFDIASPSPRRSGSALFSLSDTESESKNKFPGRISSSKKNRFMKNRSPIEDKSDVKNEDSNIRVPQPPVTTRPKTSRISRKNFQVDELRSSYKWLKIKILLLYL